MAAQRAGFLMTTLPTTDTGQWQLGCDDTRRLIGKPGPTGVVLVEIRSPMALETTSHITIRTAEEARNVITFLRMRWPEGEGEG